MPVSSRKLCQASGLPAASPSALITVGYDAIAPNPASTEWTTVYSAVGTPAAIMTSLA